ncbi:MAG: SPASM domain-containing protein [Vulcanimicrobiota bacterium]
MALEEPMSFLFCEVDFDPSGENRLRESLSTFKQNVRPYVKELTFRWSDPSRGESLHFFDAVESIGIPFAIRTEGQWSEPEAFLKRASGSSLLSTIIISGFDERYVPDSSGLDTGFFQRLRLFCTIRQARSCGIPVKTVTPVNERTERDLEELLAAACECGASSAMLERRRNAFGSDLSILRDKYRRILARMYTFKKEGWPVSFEGCMPLCAHRGFYNACGAGVTSCFIRSDGGVYLCEQGDRAVGNILEAPLHSFYECDEVLSWQSREECEAPGCEASGCEASGCEASGCEASGCEVKDECRGGCPFLGESAGARIDPLAEPSSLSKKRNYSQPISMDEELEVTPHFELRRGRSGIFLVSGREFLRGAPWEEPLFQSLLQKPSLADIACLHGEASLRAVFSLYDRGFVSFARGRAVPVQAEGNQDRERKQRKILDFRQNLLLKLSSETEFLRRNSSVLTLHPPSASFRIVPLSLCYIVKGLEEPCYFEDFCREYQWLGIDAAEQLVRNLYIAGTIEVNGLNFWNSGSPAASPEEEQIECSLQCQDRNMNYMEVETLTRILKILDRHYRGSRKILELFFEKSDKWMEEWLRVFFREDVGRTFLNKGESTVRLVLKEPPFSAEMLRLLKEHSVDMELLVREGSEYAPELIRSICSHGVSLKLRIQAETPAGAAGLFQRYRSSGVSAIRLEPSIDYGDCNSVEEWSRAYIRLFDELHDPGRKDADASLRVIDFEELIESLHTKRRKGGSCSRHPCGAATLRIAFNSRGELFPCVGMLSMEEFNCGSIGLDANPGTTALERLENVLGSLQSRPLRCRRCSWRNLCPGACPVIYRAQRLSAQDPDPACTFKRNILEELTGRIMSWTIGIKTDL